MQAELNAVQDDIKQMAALAIKLKTDEAALHAAIKNQVAGVGKQIAVDMAAAPPVVGPTSTSGS